ncbi:NACHT, LRR and PYD domains-containing protein 14-like isoform X2 [Xyrauchen texanus]|uniref:NACHT, LRR and PYD domains-containing protein 14-like isoform X2 n=1 Tax=Xyrauchen texanus TaxID=154827 RepID=UPI002242601E|nr:NACHT, LRR and PYD domains-containing protein 14-like isoform X2 [Xyrauchen texanus]
MLNFITVKCSFMELLKRCFGNTESVELDGKIMFIFDGLNEFRPSKPLDFQKTKITDVKESAWASVLLANLITGNLLPNALIWITTRPGAASQIPAQFVDRVTEIWGFCDQQKEEYFNKSLSDRQMAKTVIDNIKKSKHINSMCYIPDYCRIIAAISDTMFRTECAEVPTTLTHMYAKLLGAQNELKKENIMALGKLAFHLLVNGKSLFYDEELRGCEIHDNSIRADSAFIKVIEDKICQPKRMSFCFVNHRTQEFLAALYVTEIMNGGLKSQYTARDFSSLKLYPEKKEKCFTDFHLLRNVVNETLQRQMDLFLCFLLGLSLESSQSVLQSLLMQRKRSSCNKQDIAEHIKKMIIDSSSEKCSVLFDCLKELDDHFLVEEIKSYLKRGVKLSPAMWSALMPQHVVESSGDAELRSCHNKEEGCAVLSSALRSNPSHLRELDLSQNDIKDSGVKQLSDLLQDPHCKLEKLWLRSCGICKISCADLSSALRSNPSHLRELDLSENDIRDSGVKQLSDLLKHPQCELDKLWLRSCGMHEIGCADLSSALRSNPSHLRELDLSENDIRDSGVKKLSDLLKHPQCELEKLWLRFCGMHEIGCDDLSSALRSNPSHLRELDLSQNDIRDLGVKKLSDLLKHPQCELDKLWLRSYGMHEIGCADLSSALRSNPSHLRELDLSENDIRDSGVKKLSDLLKHPQCELEKLWLRFCGMHEIGCDDLSSALRSNPSHLRELDLSQNDIRDLGVKKLSDLLKHPQCELDKLWLRSCGMHEIGCADLSSALRSNPSHLRELDLSENDIRDSGVKKLSDLLKHPQCELEKLWLKSSYIRYVYSHDPSSDNVHQNNAEELVTRFSNLHV